jgi:hypothetical protein
VGMTGEMNDSPHAHERRLQEQRKSGRRNYLRPLRAAERSGALLNGYTPSGRIDALRPFEFRGRGPLAAWPFAGMRLMVVSETRS